MELFYFKNKEKKCFSSKKNQFKQLLCNRYKKIKVQPQKINIFEVYGKIYNFKFIFNYFLAEIV